MSKLQEFISNTLAFAAAVGKDIKKLNTSVNALQDTQTNPVQYIIQQKGEDEKVVARTNIRTSANYIGTIEPNLLDWSVEYPKTVLITGDRYLLQTSDSTGYTQYVYYSKKGLNPAEWRKVGEELVWTTSEW